MTDHTSESQTPFAAWLAAGLARRGQTLRHAAVQVGINYSYLYKVSNSHKPVYAQYRRPGYGYTVALGRYFGDMPGALRAAGYESADTAPAGSLAHGDEVRKPHQLREAAETARESLRRLSAALDEYSGIVGDPAQRALSDPLRALGREIDLSAVGALPLASVSASAGIAAPKGDPDRHDGHVADILPGGVRAIRISGDCMEPEYRSGDIVLVRETSHPRHGDKVIAVARETGEVVCKLFRSDRGKGRRLEPINAAAPAPSGMGEWDYRIVGVVEGSIRIGR